MHHDTEACERAMRSRDARFDGWFFCAVVTTGIYCRPSCPARPHPKNLRFYPSAAAAQRAGFRACRRCRPDASLGSPLWNVRSDLVARAMRLIADGVVDRDGVTGLASRLGYSVRQIQRELTAEIGAGPLQQIPYGQTESYGELAERIGSPGGARAVGMANGKNPIGVVIPCHRVVGSDGGLTGHGGGLDRKRGLLDLEPAVSGSAFLWKGHPLCRPITSAPTEPVAAGGHRDLDHPVAVGHWSPQ